MITSVTQTTAPDFRVKVNMTIWIQNALALLADDWLIGQHGHSLYSFQWCMHGGRRYHQSSCINATARQYVPAESCAISGFARAPVVGVHGDCHKSTWHSSRSRGSWVPA
eukprot:scaffold1181_cov387-Prasinococcus_capsulatus_cf.AAC.13